MAWRQVQILYWQRACMGYGRSADTVVYEEEPTAAAKLLASGGDYGAYLLLRQYPKSPIGPTISAAAATAPCWVKLRTVSGIRVGIAQYSSRTSWIPGKTLGGDGAILFMHECRSPGGHRRLVVINYCPDTNSFTPWFFEGDSYDPYVVSPASLTAQLQSLGKGSGVDVRSTWPGTPPLVRMFAGQPDPGDPAHFTIRYQMWGQEDVLDGRLMDDDSVTLTPRHTPKMPTSN
jgi:hypothetical protein